MKTVKEETSFLSPLRNKVIAAFTLAVLAIALAASTTYFSFNNLLIEVEELSVPNQKLKTISRLFRSITQLDQQQRSDAILNSLPSQQLVKSSATVSLTIDSLQSYSWSDQQKLRIQSVNKALAKREYYLRQYIKLRTIIDSNRSQKQLDSIANVLIFAIPPPDSTVTTKQHKKTTTTYLPSADRKPSFFSRLFGSKKKEAQLPKAEIKEELSVVTDTLAMHTSDSMVYMLSNLMKKVQHASQLQHKQLIQRELELININRSLTNDMLSILQELESEEIQSMEATYSDAVVLVRNSSRKIGIIITVFFIVAAALIFWILTDISKSNYYRVQLLNAKQEAERLGEVKQRFLSNMSHEIRSPLQSIIGYSEQLIGQHQDKSSVQAIQSSSKHLLQIANEILDYNRLDSGAFQLEAIPFSLNDIVNEVAASTQILANKKGIQFELRNDLKEDSWLLLGDSFRLKQILYNLVGNAVKFTDTGSVILRVSVKSDLFVTCIFSVVDTGIGLDEAELDRIFGEFEQANSKTGERFGGSGLGLSIVKKLVTLFNGEILVKSKLGQGSEFTVELKFEKVTKPLNLVSKIDKPIAPVNKLKVILIDDDALILDLCGLILKKQSVSCDFINSSQQALTYDFNSATVVFIDIRMPEINGATLAKQIRKAYPSLRLIAFTAHALPEEQRELLANGFDELLLKPFTEIDFLNLVYELPESHANSIASGTVELKELMRMVDNDESVYQSIINDFCAESRGDLVKLESSVLQQDVSSIRESVHKLAGRTGQLGLHDICKKLQSIELQITQNASFQIIKTDVSEASGQLNKFLTQLTIQH
jgi:signal transduction histidine kinase/CheY-like chemotaxis protein/HPt (histidine-containing phosphotransfer) domain-containing protein